MYSAVEVERDIRRLLSDGKPRLIKEIYADLNGEYTQEHISLALYSMRRHGFVEKLWGPDMHLKRSMWVSRFHETYHANVAQATSGPDLRIARSMLNFVERIAGELIDLVSKEGKIYDPLVGAHAATIKDAITILALHIGHDK